MKDIQYWNSYTGVHRSNTARGNMQGLITDAKWVDIAYFIYTG